MESQPQNPEFRNSLENFHPLLPNNITCPNNEDPYQTDHQPSQCEVSLGFVLNRW